MRRTMNCHESEPLNTKNVKKSVIRYEEYSDLFQIVSWYIKNNTNSRWLYSVFIFKVFFLEIENINLLKEYFNWRKKDSSM